MNNVSPFLLGALILATSCTVSFCMQGSASSQETRTFDFDSAGISTLRVRARNGSIVIHPGAYSFQGDVRITAHASSTTEAKESLQEIEISEQRSGGILELSIPKPKAASGVSSSWNLAVPNGIHLELFTSNGKIDVDAGAGNVLADTSNGSISVVSNTGSAKLDSSNGKIYLRGLPSDIAIDTSNAGVQVHFDGDWSGHGVVDTSNGSIKISCSGKLGCEVRTDTSNGKIRVQQSPGPGLLRLDTSNGNITVTQDHK
ncbi:MAG: hypothetical protein QGH51_09685 [Planctomycetota bacterium]|nr:hypothetical protein [Planctomycetota bacterium]